jgi:hypothetical protein
MYKVAEMSSHGEYSYYGSILSLLRYFLFITIVKLQDNAQ